MQKEIHNKNDAVTLNKCKYNF